MNLLAHSTHGVKNGKNRGFAQTRSCSLHSSANYTFTLENYAITILETAYRDHSRGSQLRENLCPSTKAVLVMWILLEWLLQGLELGDSTYHSQCRSCCVDVRRADDRSLSLLCC